MKNKWNFWCNKASETSLRDVLAQAMEISTGVQNYPVPEYSVEHCSMFHSSENLLVTVQLNWETSADFFTSWREPQTRRRNIKTNHSALHVLRSERKTSSDSLADAESHSTFLRCFTGTLD